MVDQPQLLPAARGGAGGPAAPPPGLLDRRYSLTQGKGGGFFLFPHHHHDSPHPPWRARPRGVLEAGPQIVSARGQGAGQGFVLYEKNH